MKENGLNKAAFLFKDAKLINLKLRNTKSKSSQYDIKPRSNSFENSLKRVLLNNFEMQSLITQTKLKTKIRKFHQSFIEDEEDYNKQVTQKMLQFGKLLNKIPHPLQYTDKLLKNKAKMIHQTKSEIETKSPLETLPSVANTHNRLNNLCLNHSEGNSTNNNVELNNLIEALKEKVSSFFTDGVTGIKSHPKLLKRKTTFYKHISDDRSRLYFHYFSSDFNLDSQGSPEYKFIKIKEESFKVISALLGVKHILIEDYYSRNITNDYIKLCNFEQLNKIIQYLDFVFELYQFYSKENEDLLHNYSVVTKSLVNDNKSYLIYISDLCSLSESIIDEENKFKSNLYLYRRESFLNESK